MLRRYSCLPHSSFRKPLLSNCSAKLLSIISAAFFLISVPSSRAISTACVTALTGANIQGRREKSGLSKALQHGIVRLELACTADVKQIDVLCRQVEFFHH